MVEAVNLNVIVQTWIIVILPVVIVSASRAIEEENATNRVQTIHMEMAVINSVSVMLQCYATMWLVLAFAIKDFLEKIVDLYVHMDFMEEIALKGKFYICVLLYVYVFCVLFSLICFFSFCLFVFLVYPGFYHRPCWFKWQ